jgi:hypothetical protein
VSALALVDAHGLVDLADDVVARQGLTLPRSAERSGVDPPTASGASGMRRLFRASVSGASGVGRSFEARRRDRATRKPLPEPSGVRMPAGEQDEDSAVKSGPSEHVRPRALEAQPEPGGCREG